LAVPIAVSGALNGSLFQDDIFAKDGLISGKWPDKKTASTARNIQPPKIVVFKIARVLAGLDHVASVIVNANHGIV
jgi:hypothetical protein